MLVAAGRRPCVEGLGLEAVGITLEQGRIAVDADYRTGCAGVYAIGDLIHGPMLAHKAMDEAVVCVERLHGAAAEVDYQLIPGVVYTQPEAASVGRSEEQLKADGTPYAAGSFPFMASGRAKALDETEGFVKVLAAPRVRPPARRAHPRPAGLGADRRGGRADGLRRLHRGRRRDHARPPDPGRSVQGGGPGRCRPGRASLTRPVPRMPSAAPARNPFTVPRS